MTPFEQAAEWHARTFPGVHFRVAIEDHALNGGYVFITPECFVLARPEGDAWHLWLAAGDMKAMLKLMPFYLPFITFHRNKGERFVRLSTDRLVGRLTQ